VTWQEQINAVRLALLDIDPIDWVFTDEMISDMLRGTSALWPDRIARVCEKLALAAGDGDMAFHYAMKNRDGFVATLSAVMVQKLNAYKSEVLRRN
jgi:hypothetical protein